MMENHSFDNRVGMLDRHDVDGFRLGRDGLPTATNPYPDGTIQHAFRMPTTCQLNSQPSQEWTASHNAYDNGKNDGFVRTSREPCLEHPTPRGLRESRISHLLSFNRISRMAATSHTERPELSQRDLTSDGEMTVR
jgi:hypothetical protein